jgi:hypothetical protein
MKVTRKAGKIEAMRQAVAGLAGAEGKVGWFESARYEGGQPVAGIAIVQEMGSAARGIPPRPFMRTTAAEKQTEWAKTAGDISRAAMLGKVPAANVMPLLCLAAEGHVRATIAKITAPPLKPATVAARKRRLVDGGKGAKASIAKPLVDTGILLNTLTSETGKK